jgi:hypothetical protein
MSVHMDWGTISIKRRPVLYMWRKRGQFLFCPTERREGRWAICESTGSYLSIVLLGEGACNSSGGLDRVKLGGRVPPTSARRAGKYHHPECTRESVSLQSTCTFLSVDLTISIGKVCCFLTLITVKNFSTLSNNGSLLCIRSLPNSNL